MSTLRITSNILRSLTQRKSLSARLLFDHVSRRDYADYDDKKVVTNIKPTKFSIYNPKMKGINLNAKNTNRVLTIPNVLTFSRIAVTPAIGYFIWNGMNTQAFACFAYAAVTDLIDGWLARRFKQESDVGAIIDPIADKLLISTCIIALYNVQTLPVWLLQSIIFRDVVIMIFGTYIRLYGLPENKQTLKYFLDFKNYPTLGFKPTLVSKCNTAAICLLIALHLSSNHLVGNFYYDYGMLGLSGLIFGMSVISLSQYGSRFMNTTDLQIRPPKSKT